MTALKKRRAATLAEAVRRRYDPDKNSEQDETKTDTSAEDAVNAAFDKALRATKDRT